MFKVEMHVMSNNLAVFCRKHQVLNYLFTCFKGRYEKSFKTGCTLAEKAGKLAKWLALCLTPYPSTFVSPYGFPNCNSSLPHPW